MDTTYRPRHALTEPTDEQTETLAAFLADLEGYPRPTIRHTWKVRQLIAHPTMQALIAGDQAPTVLDFGTTTDAHLALAQGSLRDPMSGELR